MVNYKLYYLSNRNNYHGDKHFIVCFGLVPSTFILIFEHVSKNQKPKVKSSSSKFWFKIFRCYAA